MELLKQPYRSGDKLPMPEEDKPKPVEKYKAITKDYLRGVFHFNHKDIVRAKQDVGKVMPWVLNNIERRACEGKNFEMIFATKPMQFPTILGWRIKYNHALINEIKNSLIEMGFNCKIEYGTICADHYLHVEW